MPAHGEGKGASGFSRSCAIVTVSDRCSRGERADAGGEGLRTFLLDAGFDVRETLCVPDEVPAIAEALRHCADEARYALVVTTGGTGVAPRDVTPEATRSVIGREVPGMAEAMRAESMKKTAHAMISRAVCGIRGVTLIVNLPGSPRGAIENLGVILSALSHALDKIQGDPSECAAPPCKAEG